MTDIVGTWRLVKATARDDDGKPLPSPYGPKAMGLVVFQADGRMMAVLCDGRNTLPLDKSRQYMSYAGNYTFDGSTLVTKVDASSGRESSRRRAGSPGPLRRRPSSAQSAATAVGRRDAAPGNGLGARRLGLLWSFGRRDAVMCARPLLEPGSGARRADRWTLVHPSKSHPARVESVCARALFARAWPIRKTGSRFFSVKCARQACLQMAFDKSRRKIDGRDAAADFFRSVSYFTFKRRPRWHFAVENEQKHSFPSRAPPNSLKLCYAADRRAVRPDSWEGERG